MEFMKQEMSSFSSYNSSYGNTCSITMSIALMNLAVPIHLILLWLEIFFQYKTSIRKKEVKYIAWKTQRKRASGILRHRFKNIKRLEMSFVLIIACVFGCHLTTHSPKNFSIFLRYFVLQCHVVHSYMFWSLMVRSWGNPRWWWWWWWCWTECLC